ncbi:MAG: PEGA domain-containing protein, partial [Gammaproteobacteria bacterium]
MQEQPRPDHGETIEPLAFRPTESGADVAARRIRPIHWVIGSLALVLAAVIFFVFTAKAVRLAFTPGATEVGLSGGFSFSLGEVYLLRQGDYQLHAESPGHYPLDVIFSVGAAQNQQFAFEFRPLPGIVHITTQPIDGARIRVDGADAGTTPATLDLEAGAHDVQLEAERYLTHDVSLLVE